MNEPQPQSSARLRALIVEDEWPAREYLTELLLDSSTVDVVAAVATLDEGIESLGPEGIEVDVVFVDINLDTSEGGDSGLELVRRFGRVPGAPLFVMATALKQHAAEAFDLDVVDYLLKPFSEERVRECVARVARRSKRQLTAAPTRIVARSTRGLVFLRRSEVWGFESDERLTYVHCLDGRFEIDLSLAAIEAMLGQGWLRAHRSWVVNIEHVRALERDELGNALFLGGAPGGAGSVRVPIARDKVQIVRGLLLEGAAGIRR